MFVIVSTWCEYDEDGDAIDETMMDYWQVEEKYEDALRIYEDYLKRDSLYSVPSICVVVKSELPWYSADNGYLDYILTRGDE
jgi:hypothetical protein|tara:strand:+ start:28 stop:273 length:246 start_codon:yes stop_codon:yes gene_type:complete